VKTKLLSIAASLAIFAAVSPASANLIVNGSFENGSFNSAPFDTLGAGNSSMTGWTIGSDSIDWIGSYWQPGDGLRSVDLSGNGLGSVKQDFSAVIGQRYTVSFLLAGNPDGGPSTKSVGVDVNGNFQIFTFPLAGATKGNMHWTPESFSFIANTTTETLKFTSLTCADGGANACAFGPALDNVSVSAVPELSTWGMMLLGFAGIGMIAYRRARKASPIGAVV
jgi:choice-of-anchor C domain-containing protein